MDARLAAGSYGRSWSEERVLAGIFRLFGFRCGHAPTTRKILLASSLSSVEDKDVRNAKATWNGLAMANEPIEASKHIQRAWNAPIVQ